MHGSLVDVDDLLTFGTKQGASKMSEKVVELQLVKARESFVIARNDM